MNSSSDKETGLTRRNPSVEGVTGQVLQRANILLIDDSAQDRELIERELRRVAGEVTVVAVRDASELDRALLAAPYDLAITDYQLQWSTGLEVFKRLKRHDAELPVIMFTGSGSEEIAAAAMKEGLDDYITKTVKHYSRLPFAAAAAIERRLTRRQVAAARAERAKLLKNSEERLRRAVSVGTVGVLFFRLDGRITDVNDAFQRMSGYSKEDLVASAHWRTLTVETFYPSTETAARDLLERGETEPYEKQMRRKDGSLWWGLFAPTRLSGEGYDAECVEFVIDVTDKRVAQQALEQADRRKDEFLATLAHELRNPLAPLKNGLQIARLTSRPDSSLQRTIDMMERQLNHLVHLVDDLLDVARISSGKVVLRREPVLLREVLAHAIEATRAGIDARGHELIVELSPEELVVEGDSDRLAQIFSNLISNAAKYTHSRGQIRVKLRRDHLDAVVEVIDNGIGIPREALQNVFDLFSQVREHQRHSEGGLGIGLSLVQSLVSHHGGSVSVDSAGIGTGSTFTVRLPLLRPGAIEAMTGGSEPVPITAASPRRILVVDDNVDAADSMASLIALHGHDTEVAHSGWEALDKARHFRPDLIFLDLGMPDMDGLETARRLRASSEGRKAVLVALTGWGQAADRARTKEAGFDAHVVKPIDAAGLSRALALPREMTP